MYFKYNLLYLFFTRGSFKLSVHRRILKKGGKVSQFPFKILSSTAVFSINNKAPNQHIRMISEGSCDTEDSSNDAENSALHHRNQCE